MAQVYVSIGSNIDRERYITAALDRLSELFGVLQVSPVYESESVGFDGDAFLNLVAGFQTDMPLAELVRQLKGIELDNGRRRDAPKFSSRTLDIDVLTYDDRVGEYDGIELPRAEILDNAFVLLPLAALCPNEHHPVRKVSYADLWSSYSGNQKLWQIPFVWQGQNLPLI